MRPPSGARSAERAARLEAKLRRDLGPIGELLDDPDVTDVLVNGDGRIWVERVGQSIAALDERLAPVRTENILATVASLLDTVITPERPQVGGELPFYAARIQGTIPPASPQPQLAIRRLPARVFTLEEYVAQGIARPWQAELLREALRERRNLVIAGGTGSGKTTLINALLHEVGARGRPGEHVLILQDTLELRCPAPNTSYLRSCDALDLRALVRISLRMRPDRIVVGEVRGAEALDLLKAWNTGHPGGVASVHANSATSTLQRLDQLVQEAGVPSQPRLLAEAVDLVVCIQRIGAGRVVTEVVRVDGYDPAEGFLVTTLRSPEGLERAA